MATAYEGSAPAVSQRRLAPRRCVLRIGVGLLVIVAGIWLLRWSGIGIGLPTQVEDLAWRPGSTTLAAFYWRSRDVYIPFPFGEGFRTENSDQQLAIWDTAQPRTRPRLLKLADEQPGDLTYSPDGQWLAYGRYYVYGTGAGAVQIWPATDMSAAPQTLPIPKGATVLRLRYRPDSRELAVQLRLGSDDDVVYLFDPAAPQTSPEILKFGRPINIYLIDIGYLPDGRLVTTEYYNGVRIWDRSAAGLTPQLLPAPPLGDNADPGVHYSLLAISPTGDQIASKVVAGIAIWNPAHPQSAPRLIPVEGCCSASLTFSPDGRWLAAGAASRSDDPGQEGAVWVFAPGDPARPPILLPTGSQIRALAFSPDGLWLAAGTDGAGVWIWDSQNWEKPARRLR